MDVDQNDDTEMKQESKQDKEEEEQDDLPDFFGRDDDEIFINDFTLRKHENALKPMDYQRLYLSAIGTPNVRKVLLWVKLAEGHVVMKLDGDSKDAIDRMNKYLSLICSGYYSQNIRRNNMILEISKLIFSYYKMAPLIPDALMNRSLPPWGDWSELKWTIDLGDSLRDKSHPNNDQKSRFRSRKGFGQKRLWSRFHIPPPSR